MQQEFNPYRPPEAPVQHFFGSEQGDGEVVWRDGKAVVAVRNCAFPQRCVKCNAPVAKAGVRQRNFYWHTPWLYLLILPSILIYVIVAVMARKKSSHDIALCAQHLRRRRIFIAIGWSWPLAPLFGSLLFDDMGIVFGVFASLILILVGMSGSRVMSATKIDERRARYTGCGKDFLASLPPLPGYMQR